MYIYVSQEKEGRKLTVCADELIVSFVLLVREVGFFLWNIYRRVPLRGLRVKILEFLMNEKWSFDVSRLNNALEVLTFCDVDFLNKNGNN